MRPNVQDREMVSGGVTAVQSFGISLDNSAHIMKILRDTLYSDKILAVLREYSANAWDAHRSVGKGDLPIAVALPTPEEPTLCIRDYGPGLSKEEVFKIYSQYGASTKRNDDGQVGFLGIGSKSGFAYSDSFMITSWNGGVKRLYVAALDKSDMGVINLLHEEPCGDETGLLIQVSVRPPDIEEFREKAKDLYQHFVPQPDVNIELPDRPNKAYVYKSGYLVPNFDREYSDRGWVAVMGCVPYRVNINQLRNGKNDKLLSYLENLSGVLYMGIGEVQVNASREELKYGDMTNKAIIDKVTDLVDEFVQSALNDIMNSTSTPWERRLKARAFKSAGIDLPEAEGVHDFFGAFVSVNKTPDTFFITRGKRDPISSLTVSDRSRLILKDDHRTMKGYSLNENDYLVRRKNGAEWEKVRKDLDKFLDERSLTGIPIIKLSEIPWLSHRMTRKDVTPKPSHRVFELIDPRSVSRSRSSAWKSVDGRTPTPDDVYVILERFDTEYNFYHKYHRDQDLLEEFGKEMPTIYGYRSTDKKPVDKTKLVGMEFRDWSKKMEAELYKENKEYFDRVEWVEIFRDSALTSKRSVRVLLKQLGRNHPITALIAAYLKERKNFTEKSYSVRSRLREIAEATRGYSMTEPQKYLVAITDKYPLLKIYGLECLVDSRRGIHWIQYVKALDEVENYKQGTTP